MLTQRFGSDLQKDESFVRAFIDVVRRHPGSCDEVWLASDYGFPPLDVHRQTVETLTGTAATLREAGLRVSLQISNTIGHGQYMCLRNNTGLVYPGSPVEHIVGPDGTAADYCFCWNGEHFRRYVEAEMKLYARLKPHCVWVDDDIRATDHAPVSYGCFCDACIARFNARYGASFDRPALVEVINTGDPVWRARWVEFVRSGIADLAYLIAKTIHEISPETCMGLQYCAHGGYTGYGYQYIFDAFRRGTGHTPKSRPGGGAYDDHNPANQLQKTFYIAWQNSMLPEDVTEIRPEIENLPFYAYGKSVAGTCCETSLMLAAGANAMSYSMLMGLEEPMTYHEQFFAAFSAHRPYWEALAAANAGTKPGGLCLCLSDTMWQRPLQPGEAPFAWNREPYTAGLELARTAIPLTYGLKRQTSPVYLLHHRTAAVLSDADIDFLLTQPVLTDGRSLDTLERRGFGSRLAARAVPMNTQAFAEAAANHPINRNLSADRFTGGFGINDNFRLEDRGGCEVLTSYVTSSRDEVPADPDGPYPYGIAAAIVPTDAGARWAVFGREPWSDNISYARRNQLMNAVEYAAGCRRFGAILECRQQAVLFPRENDAMETTSVSVLNCTIGRSIPLRLRIRRPASRTFVWMTPSGTFRLESIAEADGDIVVTVPPIDPWTVGTLFLRDEPSDTESRRL